MGRHLTVTSDQAEIQIPKAENLEQGLIRGYWRPNSEVYRAYHYIFPKIQNHGKCMQVFTSFGKIQNNDKCFLHIQDATGKKKLAPGAQEGVEM